MEEIEIGVEALSDQLTAYLPDQAVALIVLSGTLVVGLILHRIAFGGLTQAVASRDLFWRSLVSRTRRPLRLGFIITALGFGVNAAPLSPMATRWLTHGLLVAFIVLIGWMMHTALHIWVTVHLRRFTQGSEDWTLARKHVTQSRIGARVLSILIYIVTAAAILMTFEPVRQYGVSLLASAGAAGIVVGLAFQPVLKNLIAGIQLAITQPIRIEDAVIVEGEWGIVEEITGSYVVIKIWDWRRLIVPLSYFIEQPFQNWTRDTASLIGNVLLYLDHSADTARIREKGEAIVKASPLWDGEVYVLQVTDFRERVMEVRVLASAADAARAFDLRCEIREKLVNWIQSEMPEALPRTREEVRVDGPGAYPGALAPPDGPGDDGTGRSRG